MIVNSYQPDVFPTLDPLFLATSGFLQNPNITDGECIVSVDWMDLLSGYGNVGVVLVGPDATSIFEQFLLIVHMVWPLEMIIL